MLSPYSKHSSSLLPWIRIFWSWFDIGRRWSYRSSPLAERPQELSLQFDEQVLRKGLKLYSWKGKRAFGRFGPCSTVGHLQIIWIIALAFHFSQQSATLQTLHVLVCGAGKDPILLVQNFDLVLLSSKSMMCCAVASCWPWAFRLSSSKSTIVIQN